MKGHPVPFRQSVEEIELGKEKEEGGGDSNGSINYTVRVDVRLLVNL
jgi:hypothetical protein